MWMDGVEGSHEPYPHFVGVLESTARLWIGPYHTNGEVAAQIIPGSLPGSFSPITRRSLIHTVLFPSLS